MDDNTIQEAYMEEIYETCDWCDKPIRYGNAAVTINRNIEQMDRTDEHPDGIVTVIQSDVVTTLCGNCGNRLNIEALRKIVVSVPIYGVTGGRCDGQGKEATRRSA
jgi:hypothetical protein